MIREVVAAILVIIGGLVCIRLAYTYLIRW